MLVPLNRIIIEFYLKYNFLKLHLNYNILLLYTQRIWLLFSNYNFRSLLFVELDIGVIV